MTIHQAKITYKDGSESRFLSEDGEFFYEGQLPDRGRKDFLPMKFGRNWLKDATREMESARSIEFTETGTVIGTEIPEAGSMSTSDGLGA